MAEPRDTFTVTVAAVGQTDADMHGPILYPSGEIPPGFPAFPDQLLDVPYRERLKSEVRTTESCSLGQVMSIALRNFGFDPGLGFPSGVAFYLPEDEERLDREQPWPDTIRIVDSEGRASWPVTWSEITFSELLESSEAGLVKGDPLRPYLWPATPQGDVQQFVHVLWTLWYIWGEVLTAAATVKIVLSRTRRASEALAGGDWERRLGRPHDLLSYLNSAPRTTAEVADRLECTGDQAGALLWGLGYVCGEDGRWTAGSDEAGRLLHVSVIQIGEPLRESCRLQSLRGWGHDRDVEEVFAGGS